ncbi:MAG TPA: cbb3-type cytochrome c oxidase N-terminal domain-containing protein [Bacteroidia bacterium]|nr:cbb3-type cytochrome c oxidase N-terminal domain-containing protein [Bacteroidia bacterium]HRA59893.1 cbb3-type cytochrome c oxidase N-terminal domain-containing protein [Bacteroidia bacterium]HRB25042.1 cbb3-type cytochrome c oxidase N-terminal domain-containing protein [Bacteroidia bacterium]HRB85368.1 cbb3-type cytochrome c oxidase N-terminal domain-containing protein [Bacteroidia bacterium]HRC15081.1 cbb3-type cytochrome c oxidase N-terminal domain-containing protein [Bacteroidia bacteri
MFISLSAWAGDTQATETTKVAAAQPPDWLMNANTYLIAFVVIILLATILALYRSSLKLLKKITSFCFIMFVSGSAFAAEEAAPAEATKVTAIQPPDWLLHTNTYLIAFIVFILVVTIVVLFKTNMKLIRMIAPHAFDDEKQTAEAGAVSGVKNRETFMRKVYLRLVDSVPVAKEQDILLDHDYDGIQELDNNLPPWWKWGFYITIIAAVIYMLAYHVTGTGKLQAEEYADELAVAAKQKEERMKNSAENITEENVTVLVDAAEIAKGKDIYEKNCSACHMADGGGMVGPNLTDSYWLHGGGVKNIFKTITYGVPAKGMISWQAQLSPKQIQEVTSFIMTLHGTKPAAPKEPQGDEWKDEPAAGATATDSAAVATTAEAVKK